MRLSNSRFILPVDGLVSNETHKAQGDGSWGVTSPKSPPVRSLQFNKMTDDLDVEDLFVDGDEMHGEEEQEEHKQPRVNLMARGAEPVLDLHRAKNILHMSKAKRRAWRQRRNMEQKAQNDQKAVCQKPARKAPEFAGLRLAVLSRTGKHRTCPCAGVSAECLNQHTFDDLIPQPPEDEVAEDVEDLEEAAAEMMDDD